MTSYDPATPEGQVRLLINDNDPDDPLFTLAQVTAFLAMEGGVVKLAAAQAIDVIADDEALTSKVITSGDVSTNGAAVAAALRARSAALRAQAVLEAAQGSTTTPVWSFPDAEAPIDTRVIGWV